MRYVKHAKAMTIGAAAVLVIAAAVVWTRRESDATPPSPWIVEAAVALNRSAISDRPHWQTAGAAPAAAGPAHDLAMQGQQLRVQRRFAEAQKVYQEILAADPMDADAWAHLADCQAAVAGRDLTQGREAIQHALAINPRHLKALWLRASLELQEKQFATAAATWRELESLVPDGSSDARIIAANIAEADALAKGVAGAGGQGS